jgi:hypothetical protein
MESVGMPGESAPRKLVSSKPVRGRKVYGRSAVSNGTDTLPDVDGRTIIARRYRDITRAILVDQGGVEHCSESRQQLIRRFAAAAVLAEQLESRLANGEQIDIQEHATLSSTLVRLAARIGIDRVARDVTPSLAEYLAALPKVEEPQTEEGVS